MHRVSGLNQEQICNSCRCGWCPDLLYISDSKPNKRSLQDNPFAMVLSLLLFSQIPDAHQQLCRVVELVFGCCWIDEKDIEGRVWDFGAVLQS
mmetsp:Transcript_12179/g.28928  ORF Transcript_12179/g.28928 Transcript_12179/m.28928 type:complete len:93 (+) Transcript_12179:269-547(+)